MIKLEEGKYYRTADGRKVGPVRIAETHIPDKWALWSDRSRFYEVVGLPFEDAMDTDIIAEWVDHYHVVDRSEFNMTHDYGPELAEKLFPVKSDTPKLWRDMTPEEKGALLLAEHEGKVIEANEGDGWFDAHPYWAPNSAYRVRPEPKRETVTLYGKIDGEWEECWPGGGTHRITFDLVDGEPDCTSINMEKL